jgi:hypothetical protein
VKPAKENQRLKREAKQNNPGLKLKKKKDAFVRVPSAMPFRPPLFDVDDETSLMESQEFLKENGYVVYGSVYSHEEVEHALNLLWEFLEGLGSGIRRDDPSTWEAPNWPPDGNKGILYTHSVGHSPFLWYLRGNVKVAKIFSTIWKVPIERLLTSFDGCCVMRPTNYNPSWRTQSGWYHLDQNGLKKPGDHCFQGQVNLIDATEDYNPGLIVGSQSHKAFDSFFQRFPSQGCYKNGEFKGDFVMLKPDYLVNHFDIKPKKLCVPAGSFTIWNSRTIHCNTPTTIELPILTNEEERKQAKLERVVAYICMSPRPQDSEILAPLLEERVTAVTKTGQTTTHWPDEFTPSRSPPYRQGDPITYTYEPSTPFLSDHQKRLAGLTE